MLTYVRYSLAAMFFAASIGCISAWVASLARPGVLDDAGLHLKYFSAYAELYDGIVVVWVEPPKTKRAGWELLSYKLIPTGHERYLEIQAEQGKFGSVNGRDIFFPLWYAAFILSLVGIVTLRLGSRFTLRSAIVATTVLAVLMGAVVAS